MKIQTNKHLFSNILVALTILIAASCSTGNVAVNQEAPKREFRGAWIQCVNGQFQGMDRATMQRTLSGQLDELQRDGVNAIIFQVRAECDALYPSKYEPWSKFLSGQQGKAPDPYWDPLQWMIEQCHKRGMELHAWINPFRAKTKGTTSLAANHIALRRPESYFTYDGQYILNPGLPENRSYICKVAGDIVRRYDVDGLHIDDYFYPYPAPGQSINDEREFKLYNNGFANIGDWRRDNVNLFIRQLSDTIHHIKPWVKFGVSPFGIYRNAKNAPGVGSNTSGLQNYDDLYADVLKWVNNGWVDYCVPQLYWQIGHPAADYKELIVWWDRHAHARPLYIGEDVERTVKYEDANRPGHNQMLAKHELHQQMHNVKGTVLWYAKAVADNVGNYGTVLRNDFWRNKMLQPRMPFIDNKAPQAVSKPKCIWTHDGYFMYWGTSKATSWKDKQVKFVVYRFREGEPINTDKAENIVAITSLPMLKLPYTSGKERYVYVVTALDRMSNESIGKKIKVKL